ncbi:MAG TPA: ABC transporter permease subunit [Candidatus Limnocylindria bacterium]|nr:ABC transporter permease subunit [Candidatus Limnocylindria bacterium]
MSTTDALIQPLEAAPGGSLLRSEIRRITHRRFIRILVALTFVGFLVGVLIASTQYAKFSPELLEQAKAEIQGYVDDNNAMREEQCVQQLPAGTDPVEACGPETTAADYGDPMSYLPKEPFVADTQIPAGAAGIGFAVAVVMFLVGATWIGAEWSTRSMMALLFWEPRRLKVMAVKIGVLIAAVLLVAAAIQLLWLGAGFLLGATKGGTDLSPTFWSDLLAQQGRVLALTTLSAVGGFALANLIRNTGAALGIGFVYFAVLETAVRVLKPAWQEWLITDNSLALITKGGWEIPLYDQSSPFGEPRIIELSNLHGALVLTGAVGVVLILGVWSFRRRDLT